MSSIVGLQGKFKGNDIVKMLKTSKNRGPDASGVYLGDVKLNIDLDKFSDDNEYDIAFGQNLLCVYDTNERQDLPQPVSNDKLVLVLTEFCIILGQSETLWAKWVLKLK